MSNYATVPFSKFSDAVHKQFEKMQKDGAELYRTELSSDTLWETYLGSFPEGTNPIYKERAEYDCSCCRNFIRQLGNVVAIKDGKKTTIWDITVGGYYQPVTEALSVLVKSSDIRSVYRVNRRDVRGHGRGFSIGNATTHGEGLDGTMRTFYHFEAAPDSRFVVSSVGQEAGKANENHDMLKTLLAKITPESLEIIQDLISQNSLYRGQEHSKSVKDAAKIFKDYAKVKPEDRDIWLWSAAAKYGFAVRFRNTVIGTLASDISEGVDLERAVASFESKVAPHNYKRTSAIVTPKMINAAKEKITELGLLDSLDRRDATEADISVNNILFRDRNAAPKAMDVFDDLAAKTKKNQKLLILINWKRCQWKNS